MGRLDKQKNLPKVELEKLEINGEVIKENWPCYYDENKRQIWTYSPSSLTSPLSAIVYTEEIPEQALQIAKENGIFFEENVYKYLITKNYGIVKNFEKQIKENIRKQREKGIDDKKVYTFKNKIFDKVIRAIKIIYSKSSGGKAIPQIIRKNGIAWEWVWIEKLKEFRLISCEFDFEFNKFFIECKQSSDYEEKIEETNKKIKELITKKKLNEEQTFKLVELHEELNGWVEKKKIIEIIFEIQMEIQQKISKKNVKLLWVSNKNTTFKDYKTNSKVSTLLELLVQIKDQKVHVEKGKQIVAQFLRKHWDLKLPQIEIGGIA